MLVAAGVGVDMAPGVAESLAGEGGVCVALTCFVLVDLACGVFELPPNILLKCIEQDDNSITMNTDTKRIETFFIFLPPSNGGNLISSILIYPVIR